MASASAPTPEQQVALAAQLAAFEEVLSTTRVYLTACFAIYGWDFVITFPQEYRTMWKAERWTPVRVVFFINRYWGLFTLLVLMTFFWLEIDAKVCNKIHLLEPIFTLILFQSCEFLLGARVWAMWNRKTWIIWFFGIFQVICATVEIIAIIPNKRLPVPPGLRGCISNGGVNYVWIYWLMPLLYDTAALVLTLIPLITHWRTSGGTPLLKLFLRDGIVYFAVVFVCNLANVIYFNIPNVTNNALNAPLAVAFTTMMASRIVLNLRQPGAATGSANTSSAGAKIPSKVFTRSGNNLRSAEPTVHLHSMGMGRQPSAGDLEKGMGYGSHQSGDGVMVNVERMMSIDKMKDGSVDTSFLNVDPHEND
ncbi:hypothetical protein BT69DRAFT_1352692 [Atractiella rhizophila]|nr:hypothetical protein BT69DRAFT_1352692 [Atractiella rhizophila]